MGNDERIRGEVVARRVTGKIGPAHRHRIDVVTGEPRIARKELTPVALVKVDADAGLIVVIGGNRVDQSWTYLVVGERHLRRQS